MNIPTVTIYGIPVSKLNMKQTVDLVAQIIENRKPTQIITGNPIMVMTALENPSYMAMMRQADLVVPDGAGLVWASRFIGNPVAERVAGYDLLHELMKVGEQRDWKVFLLGASPEVIVAAGEKLRSMYPGIRLVGCKDGYFSEEQDEEVIAEIREAAPDLLFVGRSADKQEPWIAKYKNRLGVPVVMGVGGSFDVLSGKLKRAPVLFQRLHLEWFFRLLQEPWRYKRMLALPKFVMKVIREKDKVSKA